MDILIIVVSIVSAGLIGLCIYCCIRRRKRLLYELPYAMPRQNIPMTSSLGITNLSNTNPETTFNPIYQTPVKQHHSPIKHEYIPRLKTFAYNECYSPERPNDFIDDHRFYTSLKKRSRSKSPYAYSNSRRKFVNDDYDY